MVVLTAFMNAFNATNRMLKNGYDGKFYDIRMIQNKRVCVQNLEPFNLTKLMLQPL